MGATQEEPDKIVIQQNALVNTQFGFLPLQMRLFLTLLARIEFEDANFKEHFVPVSELVFDRHGGSAYKQICEIYEKLTQFTLYIGDLENGTHRRRKKPNYQYLPIISKAGYRGDLGGVLAIFSPLIMLYLLQLRQSDNFTTAALAQLRKLKSPYSLRIH